MGGCRESLSCQEILLQIQQLMVAGTLYRQVKMASTGCFDGWHQDWGHIKNR